MYIASAAGGVRQCMSLPELTFEHKELTQGVFTGRATRWAPLLFLTKFMYRNCVQLFGKIQKTKKDAIVYEANAKKNHSY